ncbi:MAG: hypothetical protein ACYSRZ_03800 [Planctomycetota bacterium]|jgi:hypothetical protein
MKISKANRCASAGSGLLIILLLVAIVFSVQWWRKKNVKDPDIFDLPPWKEWRFRESSQKPTQQPNKEQPQIKKGIFFDCYAYLSENNSPHGRIKLTIRPDGTMSGDWYGDYYSKKDIYCDIMGADFSGNVYPSKIYRNEEGVEDRSKLYFIAKGEFLLQVTDLKKKLHHEGGDIYVRGWLDREYKAVGEIIITSNEKYFKTLTWQAKSRELKTLRDLIPL